VNERMLCIVAHPDDETMLTGGALAMLARGGVEVALLCATRGEGGETGGLPVETPEQLGVLREQELACAAAALGIAAVHFLDYRDPSIGPDGRLFPYAADVAEVAGRIAEVIRQLRPDLLLTHGSGGDYGHPAHALTHRAVLAAHERLREEGLRPDLYTFCAAIPGREDHLFNQADPADVVLDVTPWLPVKAEAAACHRSQHPLFFRTHPEAASLTDVVRRTEGLHRVWTADGADSRLTHHVSRIT